MRTIQLNGWLCCLTELRCMRATGVKMATTRWIHGAWHITAQKSTLFLDARIWSGDGAQEGLRVRVTWLHKELLFFCQFYHPP